MEHGRKNKAVRLYARYNRLMHQVAYEILKDHQLAEDAISESFMRIIHNLHKIDENNDAKTCGFLTIICRNVAINMYHKKHKIVPASDTMESIPDDDIRANPEKIIISRENLKRAVEAVNQLEDKYRDPLLLHRIHGYSVEDIARFLGISVSTVYKRIERGKKKLLKMLEEGGDDDA